MSAADYQSIRESIGSRQEVAHALGVSQNTIWRRETGRTEITREMEIAILALATMGKGKA